MFSHSTDNSKSKLSKYRKPAAFFFISIVSAALIVNMVCYFFSLCRSLYRIDYSLAPHSVVYLVISVGLPPLLWLLASGTDRFAYANIRIGTYLLVGANECIYLCGIAFQLLSRIFLRPLLSLRTDEIFTKGMVLILARVLTQLPLIFLVYLIAKSFIRPILDERSRALILNFRIALPSRCAKKRIEYNLSIAKDLTTGRPVTICEKDRYLHTLVDGTSGTGKTSSTILPAIYGDLMMRSKAIQHRKDVTHRAKDGSAGNGQLEAWMHQRFPICGITVLAPDDSLTDDVCRLCEGHGIAYNRIDATRSANGERKPHWTGMNPFYISESLQDDLLHEAIVKKAVIFSDIMLVISDLKGKSDSYFSGLNRQMLTNLAVLTMLTVPLLYHRQATPEDLQILINDFDLLPEHVSKLEEINRGSGRYTFILKYINNELLGKGRTKMEDQSRGTRNIINEFLMMPASRDVYCSQKSIDFDKILENGEVTVCNYDLASGDTNAVAFGLFFLLSFNNAVLSRPGTEKTRSPHFFYIDELPVLLHSSLEKNFSLFRKFRVAMFCAIQTLDQFEKNELTKYLKGVILGCANIFVFGRSSLSDMEVFSAMAGVTEKADEQKMVSETALSDDSPSLSYSSREMWTQKNILEGIDIRMKDFQAVTLFTVRDGTPLPPIKAKVSFLKPSDWGTPHDVLADAPEKPEMGPAVIRTTPLSRHAFSVCDASEPQADYSHPSSSTGSIPARDGSDGSETISDIFS